ncbi:LAMI_0F03554g1_1 [Lachancea mirantina]|uniref:DNA helicase n=1 Tax=Lachancea mirantina TaxID=1230905 RepID=A0A1G4JXA4_9SACH|nr:LAMI_0F03554g1_1 [Lachancea mirantina]
MEANKAIANRFLASIAHEQSQDTEITARLLRSLPLQKLVARGLAINNLTLENVRTGLAGKVILEFGPDASIEKEVIKGDIKVGDVVLVLPSSSKKSSVTSSCDGVVTKCTEKLITVAVDESKEQEVIQLYSYSRLHLLKTTNAITYQRMESTMRKLAEFEKTPSNNVMQYLLGSREFLAQPLANCSFHNAGLNDSQKNAISFALSNDICIIHGPPGTGKTHTLVELVQQLVEKGERVLVCAPSNVAVDTILERLAKVLPGNLLLRLGHPARLLEINLSHSLEILSRSGDSGAIVKDIRKEIDETIAGIKTLKSFKDRKESWKEVRRLRKELRQRERKVIADLIISSRVVVSTLHGSSGRELIACYGYTDHLFDAVIIDEISQSLEPQCWIPLISHCQSNITKLVLAGDDKQLPPTIKTEDDPATRQVLSTTLFDRLVDHYGSKFKCFLNIQYRMNSNIMEFSSKEMYGGHLRAADSVANWMLIDLPGVDADDNTTVPLIWYDTQGDDYYERKEEEDEGSSSKFNENEAQLGLFHVNQLIGSNVKQTDIGIISPYNAQVSLLKKMIHSKYPLIEVSSIDGFQGREKEVIILSLVRSNDKFEVGFLSDERRLNVAMTRPKKQLCVIGNMETLERSRIKYLKDWVNWSEENSEIRYPDLSEILE